MFSLRNTFMTIYKNRVYPNYWDLIALGLVLGLIFLLAWNAKQMSVPYQLGQPLPISLDPSYLPQYAGRTVLRMLIAMCFSLLFTFIFGTWSAKSKRAAKLIIPFIDIMQSVPILGFLSIAVVAFIRLFPNSILGPECAAIFAIFTSQAWNMALGFYQTVRTVPAEMREASKMLHLSAWQRFWRIEVPFSMPGLLWNMMVSMSAGWFFVVASEAVSVANQEILLPGIGSYIAVAINTANVHAIWYAIFTMFIVILIYDQLLFRPLIAWSDKFKPESVSEDEEAQSWVINLFQRTRLLRNLGKKLARLFDRFVNIALFRSKPKSYQTVARQMRIEKVMTWVWNLTFSLLFIVSLLFVGGFIFRDIPLYDVLQVFVLGLVTAFRVFVMIVICSLVWVPIGVWIGLRSKVSEYVQPLAQFLAAFPVNLLYPLFVVLIIKYHLNPEIWLTPLITLGSQWYIVFNVIAGASVLPKDLLQVADNFSLSPWLRWRRLILPGIFPYYITGAITAAGGAWNASIVAEVVDWGNNKLVATGLGAYITQSSQQGNFLHLGLGIGMMCLLVLIINRLVWRPLYVLAETRYQLD